MNYTIFKNRKVAYQVEGKGIPVVFLHGFCADSRVWREFTVDLLEEGYRVITIDLPGYGESEVATDASIDYYAQAVLAVLADCGYNKYVLIGHSMGGYTALAIAEQAPEQLLGIGLFHSHPYADTTKKQADRHKQIHFVEKMGHQLFVKQLTPKLFATQYAQSHPFELDKLIHRAARFPQQGITDGLRAMAGRANRSKVLENITVPVLFIVGEEDAAVPAEYSRRQLALPAVASIHIMQKVGHMGMIESKRKTQLLVRRFIDFCQENQPS